MPKHRYYLERRERGICVECAGPAARGLVRCRPCAATNRERTALTQRSKEQRRTRKETARIARIAYLQAIGAM